ncbi:probable lysophospholipase BODYGUARD 4 isoform X2 [Spinacia oleracea]|uniref:Probable lysophospholipase BODYGUARD 4 isoform X2 n=1 Tax=Spinacia oleracea TaxID=3562 RepID=A0A9R0HZM3_SPIOL|nr:probable lysophospholipase BODYGUARD 4 isoform X2 [Spinacia oleracea]
MGIKQQIKKLLLKFLSSIVFTFFDLLDYVLCIVYSYLDDLFEGSSPSSTSCYCFRKEQENNDDQVSTTLYRRQSLFRDMGCFELKTKRMKRSKQSSSEFGNRWSDCGCESCVAWIKNGDDLRLHLVVQDPADMENSKHKFNENVIFLHGFISSSSLWTETVFCNLSEDTKKKYKLFAIDLLGFGRSPKPRDCLYTMRDHLEMIEKSVIFPFGLSSFHLVAHSMGSIIALALAAKYPQHIKSITLIAPPYFPSSSDEDGSLLTLRKVADKRLWPPLVFGASFMSWYEHLGRTICFIICRNHRIWEFLLRLLTWRRDLQFSIMDITRHTHHSAWHTMHNVICGGAKFMEEYLTILRNARVKFTIFQGDEDQVLPVECSYNIKMRVPHADVIIIPKTSHSTIILRQIKELTKDLEGIWMSCH